MSSGPSYLNSVVSCIPDNLDIPSKYNCYHHIAFTGTENYIAWIGVTMSSIMKSDQTSRFCFHILVDRLKDADKRKLKIFSDKWKTPIYLYFINDQNLKQYAQFDRYVSNGKYSTVFLYRFLVPLVTQCHGQNILYMDGDIVCNGNLSELWNINMDNFIIAAAEDLKGDAYARLLSINKYFNAGVLLINTEAWNEQKLTDKFLQKMKHESEKNHQLGCADQDVLNMVLHNAVLFIDKKYNMPYRLVQPSFFKPKIINSDPMKACLIHFIGAVKPWTTYNQSVPIVKVWSEAKADSPWADEPLHIPQSQKAFHQAARDWRRQRKWIPMIQAYGKFFQSKFDGTPKSGY